MQITKRYTLYFNPTITTRPLIYDLIKEYNIEVNILRAEINPGAEGYTLLDMTAEEDQLNAAFTYLKSQGVKLVPSKYQVDIDTDSCVHCGACTAVCFAGALTIAKPDWQLNFNPEKCISCSLCFPACPLQALKRGTPQADI